MHKSIYGLKQAPQAWFIKLKTFIVSLSFLNSHFDSSLFIHSHNSILVYFLVYVDDLLITKNSLPFIYHVSTTLFNRFSIKDLGHLQFRLGVEVIPSANGQFLSQQKYVQELLPRFHMEGIKSYVTPLSCTTWLIQNDGSSQVDNSQYCSLIGSLQYLSISRPNVAYSINKLA